MPDRKKTMRAGILALGFISLLAYVYLATDRAARREGDPSQQRAAWLVPAGVETRVPPPTFIPDAEATARLFPTSVPETPYISPPAPTPLPSLQPDTFPPPKGDLTTNIAWSAGTDNTLTIWVGRYSDDPRPSITGARAIARWNDTRQQSHNITYLGLVNMAFSPNGKYLAALTRVECEAPPPEPTATPGGDPTIPRMPNVDGPCTGVDSQNIYVFELATGRVQTIPDYNRFHNSDLHGVERIIGWFDNDRFGIKPWSGQMLVANRDGSPIEARVWPGASEYDNVYSLSLLPDHKTIFAWVGDGFYFRDAPTGEARRVGDTLCRWCDPLIPSPNGKFVSFQDPAASREGNDARHYELWAQELATDKRYRLIGEGVWDTQPAWSPDSSRIAFAYTEKIPAAEDAEWVGLAEKVDTNIYIADIATQSSRQLTNFAGAHNRDIQWTPGGNLLLSSTAGSQSGGFNLVAVSSISGKATTLVSAMPGESLLRSTFFGEVTLPGMPRSGLEGELATPIPPGR